jgi:ornithine cyclodeaminase
MRVISADDLHRVLDYASLIDRLDAYFRSGNTHQEHVHYPVNVPGGAEATLIMMPCWEEGAYIGVKIVNVFPDNGARGLPTIMATYVLSSGETGEPLAMLDGNTLTARRTASASALASRYLSRPSAARLVMVGTGVLAKHLIGAHATARPIADVKVWGRSPEKAEAVAESLNSEKMRVTATTDLEAAVAEADIISAATPSLEPLVLGAWLKPGQHVDLVGSFKPDMREADDEVMRRATIFADTRADILKKPGDIVQPLESGAITAEDVVGDLFGLAQGTCAGRRADDEITLFKSMGTAIEDLAAATLALERL